jgi:hypothetical protein
MCSTLKKLSKKSEPFVEAFRNILEIVNSAKAKNVRILEHLLSYAEYQFGQDLLRLGHRDRGDGEWISNWDVEIEILLNINGFILSLHNQNMSLSSISRNDLIFPCLERMLIILNPWLIHLNSHASGRTDNLNDEQFSWLLLEFQRTEQRMAVITIDRRQLDVAEGHCQRSLAFARRFVLDGDERTSARYEALQSTCLLREKQIDYPGALLFAEECYNVVVESHDCVHPQVQKAAGVLIDILIKMGNLFDAERYAQVTYSNLRDKKNGINQEGSEVGNGACDLATVIFRQKGDLIKAEELVREALRSKTILYGSEDHAVGKSCDLLAQILSAQNNFGDETRVLFQRCLGIYVRNEGPDELNTALANLNIGRFYHQLSRLPTTIDSFRAQLLLAQSHFEESLRIYLKIHGPTYPPAVSAKEQLTVVLSDLCNHPE